MADRYEDRSPWRHAPLWAIELRELVSIVIANQGASMSQVDDLTAAVGTLSSNMTAHDVAVQTEIAALKAAVSAAGVGTDPAIATAIQNISNASSTLASETAALAASVAPPAPPAPVPAPPAPPTPTPTA